MSWNFKGMVQSYINKGYKSIGAGILEAASKTFYGDHA
jgi:hypothetical protein